MQNNLLLVLNTIKEIDARNHFDQIVIPRITASTKIPFHFLHLGESNPDLDIYTHLLLTGSELSASRENPEDKQIYKIINNFLEQGKPILGICHGHQMLAKALVGKTACRKADKPEFGWIKMKIKDNKLFRGIDNPIFLNSHYDEVSNLTDDFKILASSPDCEIQSFQYRNDPIWGIQFHPEMLFDDGNAMVDNHLQVVTEDKEYYYNQLDSAHQLQQNLLIFKNFFSC